ncbi:hypothetical protein ACH5RR_034903 [Cinchona calisaya]|uniref:RRM domain-containing protein n=1 Tax=Cinchona calisaya TaxID=153742 RepID=A0ABD2YCA7_9GENT
MASAEQPLKKRKLYEQFQQSSPSPPPPPPPPPPLSPEQQQPPPPGTPPAQPLTQEEILRRQQNLEEIRKVYNCLKQIKCCIAQEEQDPRRSPDLEQAYLYLITASRGCTSVQRIVAELIPRYASYCPTALEAAEKVVINMHNCSLAVISNGEDFDGVAFETAEACIFGLVYICEAAAQEAPSSSVIQGICSAVFLSVFTFLISSFEGKDIFQIIDKESLKILYAKEFISEFKEKFLDGGDSTLLKLSKFRAVSFMRLFFSCPKDSLSACFELFNSAAADATPKGGHYFLRQLTNRLDNAVSYMSAHRNDGENVNLMGKSCLGNNGVGLVRESHHVSENVSSVSRNCMLGLVLCKNVSLKSWIFSRYKKLYTSASSEVVSDVTSALDGIFESFREQVNREDTQADCDVSESSQSKYSNQYLVPRETSQQETSSEVNGKDCTSKMYDKSCPDNITNRFSSSHLKRSSSVDYHSSASPSVDSGGSRSMDFDFGGPGDSHSRSSVPRDSLNRHILSPITRTPVGFRSSLQGVQRERSQILSMDVSSPTLRSLNEGINCSFDSPKHHLCQGNPSMNQVAWYSDGDPAAMDIFAASKQLWLGSLGPDASEGVLRSQFEKFGTIDQFIYSPFKGSALIEYRNIIDAVKARENMRGCSTWGGYLDVKFTDTGFGTRGGMNGVAVGSTCHVYIGHVSNQWARDEIMNEVRKVLHKGPRWVTDLSSEGALLMEFDAPDEATIAMANLRRWRRESGNPLLQSNGGPVDVLMHTANARPGSAAIPFVAGSNHSVNNIVEFSQAQALSENPSDSYLSRGSRLSSMVSQLRTKYNVARNLAYSDTCVTGNHYVASRKEEQLPTSTLWISMPHMSPMFLSDDELFTLCNVAINSMGSIVRLTRQNISTGSCWFVECDSIETAKTLLSNIRDCPEIFFQIEFSHPGKHQTTPLVVKPDNNTLELTSPRLNPENHGIIRQGGNAFQPNWSRMPEVRSRPPEMLFVDPSHGGGHVVSSSAEQMWMYRKPEIELHSGPRSILRIPAPTLGPPIAPPQPVQAPQFRPLNFPPNSSWDARGLNNHLPINPMSPRVMPNIHRNPIPPPFIPASVTPIAQYHGNSMPQMFSVPVIAPPSFISPPPPSQPDLQPPLPYSQPPVIPPPLYSQPPVIPPPPYSQPPVVPPPPYSQPPVVPPPPSSPPPLPPPESSSSEYTKQSSVQYKWQGTLSKSGVRYCTIYAQRVDSDICKYLDEMAEPTEWPAKLDMTKRTDFRHVKTTFSNTPSHKREICWLLPSSQDDHKGFQDFISYLQQRECAGVIKIPAVKSMWARLLFILPYSNDLGSMLSIAPNPSLRLVGLVLPKETNFDWV